MVVDALHATRIMRITRINLCTVLLCSQDHVLALYSMIRDGIYVVLKEFLHSWLIALDM